MSLKDGDSLSWYARKVARATEALPGVEPPPDRVAVLCGLLEQLRDAGIKGDFEHMTLYTRRLPQGCRSCVAGKGSNSSSRACARENASSASMKSRAGTRPWSTGFRSGSGGSCRFS